MASHRKPRTRLLDSATGRCTALGVTTAALASVTLLTQTAGAAPSGKQPSIEEVKKKVDTLNHQAETATEKYDAAKEKTDKERAASNKLLEQVAKRTEKLNAARRVLGNYAAAQYRTGGLPRSATALLFSSDPEEFLDETHLVDRLTGQQAHVVDDFRSQQAKVSKERVKAVKSLSGLTSSQQELASRKKAVQKKLAASRTLLTHLTAQQKARLAAINRKKEEEAKRKAEQLAKEQQGQGGTSSVGHSAMASKAIAFAKAQLGKPYVWGATGPNSFDCSGLTQAAWKAAGVSLPRTTWEQVKVGTRVSTKDLQPGDLVFFYSDISHVGLYIGNGMMIHAPHTGTVVKEAPITEMPIYGSVRPS